MVIRNNYIAYKLVVCWALALCVGTAWGQRQDGRITDPETLRLINASLARVDEANKALKTGYSLLRAGKYSAVMKVCNQAMAVYVAENQPKAEPVHELMAECYLAQKQYHEALKEASFKTEGGVGYRINMTKALILINLGRLNEAANLVTGEIGTVQEPKPRRNDLCLWELPWDRSDGEKALRTTAYLLRANAFDALSGGEEGVRNDFDTALKLTPQNPSAELLFGRYLYLHSHYKEAVGHFEAAERFARGRPTIDTAQSLKRRAQEAASRSGG